MKKIISKLQKRQGKPFSITRSDLISMTCLILVSSVQAQTLEPDSDPTQPSTEMAEVLRAIRSAGSKEEQDTNPTHSSPQIRLAAWVAGGEKAAAVLSADRSYFYVREGESFVANGMKQEVTEVSTQRVALRHEAGAHEIVLGERGASDHIQMSTLDFVQFDQVPLYFALRAFSEVTDTQLAMSTAAQEFPVSLHLNRVDAAKALDALVLTHGLYAIDSFDGGIIRIYTSEEYSKDPASLRDEVTRVFTLRYPNSRDVALSIRDLFGERVRLSSRIQEDEEPGELLSQNLQQRFERFDTVDARGQGFGTDNSGNNGSNFLRNNSSRFRNSLSNRRTTSDFFQNRDEDMPRIDALSPDEIAALEAGDEAVLDRVLQSHVDIFVSAIDRLNKVAVRTRDEKTMKAIAELIESLDVPTPLVFIEVNILEIILEDGLDTAFDWSFEEGNTIGSFLPASPATGGDLIFSYLDASFQAQIRMLQTDNKATILGRPNLLTANNEVSRLFIGQEVPLNRSFEGGASIISPIASSTTTTPGTTELEFRPVGSTLLITPNINEDRTVTLRILQEQSKVEEGGADILIPSDGGGFDNRSIDIVASQTVSGTFVAHDRQTIAVGGLIEERIIDRRSQIPILGDIPFLGRLARNQSQERARVEIILLLTPYVISTPNEEEAVLEQFLENNSIHPLAPSAGKGELGIFEKDEVLHHDRADSED